MSHAQALWYTGPGKVEIRDEILDAGEITVRALYSGISRGTERLVSNGRVPPSEYRRMRCPRQQGDFPFPVKYGYALVARVETGPTDLTGQAVFLLHPHQTAATATAAEVHRLPEGLPPRRATLTANMETALNVVWDAGVGPGDKVLVVGGGVLGLLIAGLSARIAGTETTVTDIDPARATAAKVLGARFAAPAAAPREQDVVIHTSANDAGLALALACAGEEAKVVEASWYGDRPATISLGEAFHARRLQIISSQVGAVSPTRRPRWSYGRRLQAAMALLRDDAFDVLITAELAFAHATVHMPRILGENTGLMTVIRYP
jgi:NADPH:quinone reductase-like Zn-dependent oxidoreductase